MKSDDRLACPSGTAHACRTAVAGADKPQLLGVQDVPVPTYVAFLRAINLGKEPFGGPAAPRTFLEDGDTVTIRATAPGALGGRIALGEVTGTITPAA